VVSGSTRISSAFSAVPPAAIRFTAGDGVQSTSVGVALPSRRLIR
jgi:hypothetical protein